MPRAEKSLRQHLTDQGGTLPVGDAVEILKDITRALVALEADVVHRDLKPENVLLFEGEWNVADFGISRYAEATTAPDTWKYAKTWAYAAPEQWRGERATSTTDVYATGVIAYELLTGNLPFQGPDEHDYREQHLHEDPPHLSGSPAPLASLITECLYKASGTRPNAENIHARLQNMASPASAAGQQLQQADLVAAQRRSDQEAHESASISAAEIRDSLAHTASQSLTVISENLRDRIRGLSPQCVLNENGPTSWRIKLMDAEIGIGGFNRAAPSLLDSPGYPAPFDVVAYSSIHVHIPTNQWGFEGRSHSLWFCDAQTEGVFRWYETAFMFGVFTGQQGKKDPFALEPRVESGRGLAPIMGTEVQPAWPFTAIDQGLEDEFIERWIGWFADAAQGRLRHSSHMPEKNPDGSWRRA